MMGYVFLLLSVLCGSAKGFVGKKSSADLETLSDKLYFGAVRTAMCALLGLFVWSIENDFSSIGKKAIIISLISGVSMSVFLLSWIAAVRRGAYVRLDVCCQTGMVIPCILAAPLLGEKVSFLQYAALGLLVFAIVLLSDRGKGSKGKMSISDVLLLFVVWLSSGTNSLTVKLFAKTGEGSGTFYNLVTFSVASAVFALSYLAVRGKNRKTVLPKIHYAAHLPVMAISLYLNIILQTAAARHLSSMIMFPLQTVLALLFSAIMATVFFHEKPTKKNIIGLVISAASIIMLQ